MNNIYHIIILIGFGLSTFLVFKKESSFYLKTFSPFLAFSLLIEYSGVYLSKKGIHTIPLYDVSGIIEFCFYLWVFYSILISSLVKRIVLYLIIGFPSLSIINMFFFQGINNFNSTTYSLGCLMIIFLCIFYFFELFNTQINFRLSNDPAFWICTGLLFFYSVSFPIFVSANLMKHFSAKLGELIFFVVGVMNIILYSLFCVAFICQLKLKKENNK